MRVSLLLGIVACTTIEASAQFTGASTDNELLFSAVRRNKADLVKEYLDHGSANARDRLNNTPLMFAAINGNVEIVKMLLAAGADPKARSDDGTTALGVAALGG